MEQCFLIPDHHVLIATTEIAFQITFHSTFLAQRNVAPTKIVEWNGIFRFSGTLGQSREVVLKYPGILFREISVP